MVLERKLFIGDLSGDLSPVMARILSEIKDVVRELRHAEPDSVLVRLAEHKIEMIEGRATGDSGRDGSDMAGACRA